MKKKFNTNIFQKNKIVLGVIFIFFIAIILQILYLSISPIINGVNLKNFVSNRNTKKEILEASRGNIFDASGKILSQNVTAYTVIAYLDPKRSEKSKTPLHVVDTALTAEKLSPILNMSKEDIEKILKRENAYQVEIGPGGRGISELTKEEITKLELPGIDFIKTYKRYYPSGDFLSYTVGYAVNKEDGIVGEMGVEGYFDEQLKGQNGYKEFQKDLYGFKIPNTNELIKQPIAGKDIYLTINNDIQMFVENAIKNVGNTFDPEFISLTVMDAKSGKILGTGAYPSFDPNLRNITNYLNPLTSFAYEPGSTMKMFTFMAAMEKGVYNGSDTFMSGSKEFKNGENETIKISDWNQVGWGRLDYDTGFALSSNMAVASLLDGKINREDLKIYFEKFGFGSKTGIELPKELSGKIDFKYEVEVVNAGFGQGITTTPIQNLQALTTIANDGIMIRPQIIDKIIDPKTGKVEYESKREELGKIVTSTTINKMKELMYRVINDPKDRTTGYMYKIDGYDIIGKTGTAQIFDNKTGKYMEGKFDSIYSFAGMFPYDNPEIIIYASLKRPKFGGVSALSPAVKTVIEDVAKYYNIYKEDEIVVNDLKIELPSFINKNVDEVTKYLNDRSIKYKVIGNGTKIINQYPGYSNVVLKNDQVILITNEDLNKVPDFVGYSLKEANFLCDYFKYNCKFEGNGYVTEQSIKSNDPYTNELILKLIPKYIPSS